MTSRLADLSKLDDQFYETYGDGDGDGCGLVWPYEVSEPYGNAIALHVHVTGSFPTDVQANDLLAAIFQKAMKAQGVRA